MSQIIVPRSHPPYVSGMRDGLAKLLLMLAVLLMPFGMAAPAAPAAAAAPHAPAAAAMPMQHCPDTGPASHGKSGGIAACTMACAATLPAAETRSSEPLAPVAAPTPQVVAEPLLGLHPETATPPPRRA